MMGWVRSLTKLPNAWGYLFFFMSHRGDSGQKKMPSMSGMVGIKAEPIWSRQAILPVSLTMRLAAYPRKMPERVSGDWWSGARLTERHPELPEYDQSTADSCRRHFGRVNGAAGVLHAEADAHDEPSGEESLPRLGTAAAD